LIKKFLTIGIIILFLCLGITPSIALNTPIKTISSGNILYVGGTGPNNYTNIQDAIDNACNGDTVFVYDDSSPYMENLIVDKSIKLIGENRDTTFINGSRNSSLSAVNILSENVILSCFTILKYGIKKYSYDDYIIKIQSDYNSISGNILMGNISYGIRIDDSQYNNISDNVISKNLSGGIFLYNSNYTKISNNYISSIVLGGILLQDSNNNNITNNFISNCNVGIYLLITRYNYFYGNIITNNAAGIYSEGFSINNIIIRNNIAYNKFYGLYISSPSKDKVIYNNFIGNKENAYFFNNIWLALRGEDYTDSKSYFPKILWDRNYWDETRLQFYIIPGFVTFFGLNFLIRYLFKYYISSSELEFCPFPINCFNLDKNPVQEPYDIDV